MLCGKTYIADEKHPEREKGVHRGERKDYRDVVLNKCKGREREREREKDDEEARVIEHRVRNCFEFIAAEYRHRNMYLSLFILQVKMKKCGTMHER